MRPAGLPPEVRAYLDHASVSPLRPEVIEALGQMLGIAQADPGRGHAEALVIRDLIEDARASVAGLSKVTPRQVVFTASIAESVTTSLAGLVKGGQVLAPFTERSSVLDAARHYGTLTEVPVDSEGLYDLEALGVALRSAPTDLVCCQVANHETGVLNDVGAVVELARTHGSAVHLDASMALGHVEIDLGALDADAVTIGGELIGGPMGSAALLVRAGRVLPPLILGGAQERARRAGLEAILGIVGFGIAAEVLRAPTTLRREASLAADQIAQIESALSEVEGVHQVGAHDPRLRAPHLRCFTIDGVEAEPVLMGLDRAGISVHSGSACASESLEPSPVLAAMGVEAAQSLRVSVGWSTMQADVDRLTDRFAEVVSNLRSLQS